MSNLLVTIIAIGLVAVTVAMAAYYGGSAWEDYQAEARASTLLNEAQQLSGALSMYVGMSGFMPSDIEDLTDSSLPTGELLKETPDGLDSQAWQMKASGTGVQYVAISLDGDSSADAMCLAANKKVGLDTVENCATAPANAVCCDCDGIVDFDAHPYCEP